MRRFFTFGPDPSREDLQHWIKDNLRGFDFLQLVDGKRVEDFPSDYSITVSNDTPTDLLGDPYGWVIMSRRALAVVSNFLPEEDLQVFEPKVIEADSLTEIGGYFIVNNLRIIKALAYPPPEGILYKDRAVVKEVLIPGGTHAFRLEEEPSFWIVSEPFFNELSDLEGIVGTPIRTT